MNGSDGILKSSSGVGSRRWSLARVTWLALAIAGYGVLVTAPVQPCPLPTFVARDADTSGARWVTDRSLALFRTAVAAPFSFANGLYLLPVP